MEASDYTDSTSAASNGSNQHEHDSPWVAHTVDTAGRPELPVIAAFVGGFVFAKLLGRFGGGGDG
jgi:hypothetical protein